MTNCTQSAFEFPGLKRKKIQAEFSGGDITSDGGVLLLRQVDKRLKLLDAVNQALADPRDPRYIKHSQLSLLQQRVYGLCLGYEDLNDHESLRNDPALQTAVNREDALGSQATLCRLENRIKNKEAVAIHEIMVDQFIASFHSAPKELILDFDATDDRVHGQQIGRAFHGYYDHYCFLPLYVFCNDQLLVSYLRPSNIDGAKHAWAILALLVKRLRKTWPDVRIIIRGDSGFCRWWMLRWCDRHNVKYIIGIAKNARLLHAVKDVSEQAERQFQETNEKVKLFTELQYAAQSWDTERRVIAKLAHMRQGANPRFVVTNLDDPEKCLYEKIYCARGDMENRIKEQQLGLFADRTSCHNWWPNQFRVLLSSLAYILMENIRRLGLKETDLERAQVSTIRLKFLKVGAVILRNTRRIRFLLSSAYPYQSLFFQVAKRLDSG